MMNCAISRSAVSGLALVALSACMGGGGGGGGGGGSLPTEPTSPAIEVTGAGFTDLSVRNASPNGAMAYVLLDGQTVRTSDSITINYSNGVLSGGELNAIDIDSIAFTNPAGGEFSRVFRITGENLFGVVGLDAEIPAMGTFTNYNDGWVGMIAAFEDRTLTLEGDATFTATWGSGDLSGRFFNLSGRNSQDQTVTNVGTIVLTGANITGDQFVNGVVTGTGAFAGLDGGSNTSGTRGFFFGPQADELGGVLKIDDVADDIQVIGAFQAD